MKYFPSKEDIKKLDMLPQKQNRWQYHTAIHGHYDPRYSRIGHYDPYKVKDRVLHNNIGKSFNMAFHYFCTKVKQQDQKLFLEEFEQVKRHWRYSRWYTDDNGLIQKLPSTKPKKEVYFRSEDYLVEKRHKITGAKPIIYDWTLRKLPKWKIPHESDYHNVVVSGWIKKFSSRNDPEYKRLYNERERLKRKWRREHPFRYMSDEKFREILNRDKLDDEEENKVKILKKGFDPVTSFRA